MSSDKQDILKKIEGIQNRFAEALPQRILEIKSLVTSFKTNSDKESENLHQAMRLTHKLAGSGATFGFPGISKIAAQLEKSFNVFIDQGNLPTQDEIFKFKELLDEMENLARTKPKSLTAESTDNAPEKTIDNLIYIIDDDADLSLYLKNQLELFGYQCLCFSTTAEAAAHFNKSRAAVILMDIIFPEGSIHGVKEAEEFRKNNPNPPPLIFLSCNKDFKTIVASLRAGGSAYIEKPVDLNQLLDQLDRTINSGRNASPYRVLIIDDDTMLSQYHEQILNAHGVSVTCLEDPYLALKTIQKINPDLIVMDYHFSDCNGFEIAAAIRQFRDYEDIPVVFLSTDTVETRKADTLHFGGDDFLAKPVANDIFVATVLSRAKRSRHLHEKITTDRMTGVLTQKSLLTLAEREFTHSKNSKTETIFIFFYLENQRNLSLQERDLQRNLFTRNLLQHRRPNDGIGCFQDNGFCLILPETSSETGTLLLNQITGTFSKLETTSNIAIPYHAKAISSCDWQNLSDLVRAATDA